MSCCVGKQNLEEGVGQAQPFLRGLPQFQWFPWWALREMSLIFNILGAIRSVGDLIRLF